MLKKWLPLIIGVAVGALLFLIFRSISAGICADGPCGFSNNISSVIAFLVSSLIGLIISLVNKKKV